MPSYFGGLILPSSGGTCSFRGSISCLGVGVGVGDAALLGVGAWLPRARNKGNEQHCRSDDGER